MKALSIRQPWVWAIMHAGKRIENRDWYCGYRGPILLHASKWWDAHEIDATMRFDIKEAGDPALLKVAPFTSLNTLRASGGHLLARADIVGCLRPGDPVPPGQEAWYMGSFGIVLANVEALSTPIPCRGQLGLFDVGDIGSVAP